MPLVDKYRPTKFSGIVGRDEIVESIKKHIASPEGIPHLLFSGNPGGGKTLMAEVIANEMFGANKADMYFEFNASNERGIEMVRTQIVDIAKRRPMNGQYKVVLLDESDQITFDAQASLRRILEQYSKTTRFIISCNFRHKIIQPLVSRCVEYSFTPFETEFVAKYMKAISKKENMTHSDQELLSLAKRANGDLRKALNLLEGIKQEVDVLKFWEEMTLPKFKSLSEDERIMLSFKTDDAESIFNGIWEFVKREKAFQWIPLIADAQSKMNMSLLKNIFVTDLLAKMK